VVGKAQEDVALRLDQAGAIKNFKEEYRPALETGRRSAIEDTSRAYKEGSLVFVTLKRFDTDARQVVSACSL
jgi:hypothetical protein